MLLDSELHFNGFSQQESNLQSEANYNSKLMKHIKDIETRIEKLEDICGKGETVLPKTQYSMLECMEEHQITIDGNTIYFKRY